MGGPGYEGRRWGWVAVWADEVSGASGSQIWGQALSGVTLHVAFLAEIAERPCLEGRGGI